MQFKMEATQNYPDGIEESWSATIDGLANLEAHIGSVCQSVTASSWVFAIVPIRSDQ